MKWIPAGIWDSSSAPSCFCSLSTKMAIVACLWYLCYKNGRNIWLSSTDWLTCTLIRFPAKNVFFTTWMNRGENCTVCFIQPVTVTLSDTLHNWNICVIYYCLCFVCSSYCLVYIIFLIHGVAVLMPWNMFINANDVSYNCFATLSCVVLM